MGTGQRPATASRPGGWPAMSAEFAGPGSAERKGWGGDPSEEYKQEQQRKLDTFDGFPLTEDGIALAFTARHRDRLRFCHDTGSWFEWDGSLWRQERTRLAFEWCRRICRDMGQVVAKNPKTIADFGKAKTAAAVERFAQADRAFAVTADVWDKDTFLLGTPSGTVD